MDHDICFISPYPELTQLIKETLPSLTKKVLLEEGALTAAEPIVEKAKNKGIEVIITTQGNMEHLRSKYKIPIIALPVSTFDTLFALNQAKKIFGEPLALFSFQNPNPRFHEMNEIIGIKIEQYLYHNKTDGRSKLKEAKQRGIKAVVSGGVIAQIAKEQGCPCIAISISHEAVLSAYEHAKDVARARRKERWEAYKLKTIIDYSSEGIIAVNADKKIIAFNPAAERLLDINATEAYGKDIQEFLPNNSFQDLFLHGDKVVTDKVCDIKQKQLLVNIIPVYDRGKKLGLISTFQKASRIQSLEEKIRRANYEKGLCAKFTFDDIIGKSKEISETIIRAQKFALSEEAVLISGETGTGKELFAQSIHNYSDRANQPFIAVNCAALPSSLLESELFGYAEGAFTGAKKGGRTGLFELAHKGTVFLDEIGEIPPEIQSKLLRVLEQKEVMRIGDDKLVPIDVRIIAATNKNLQESVNKGDFRNDLYYRINILELPLPPLRKRKEDILPLAIRFIREATEDKVSSLFEKALDKHMYMLFEHNFPGNVRELENLIKRAAVIIESDSSLQSIGELLHNIIAESSQILENTKGNGDYELELNGDLKETLEEVENQLIASEYLRLKGNKTELAKRLGIGRTTLWRKLNEAGIE